MIILASASPRRQELLQQIGCEFICKPTAAPELTAQEESQPAQLVLKNSKLKAEASAKLYPEDTIIGADTVVALEDKIFGKPASPEEAFHMLSALSGKAHTVYTGVTLIANGKIYQDYAATKVFMDELSPEEIHKYIATHEPDDKAGAYAIQGYAAKFIKGIQGCYFNVVGLPLNLLYTLTKKADVNLC